MKDSAIRLRGDKETARAFGNLADDLDGQLEQAGRDVARQVEEKATSNAQGRGGVAGKSAPSLDTTDVTGGGGVGLGGSSYPFALGAEFGSMAYPQFKAWLGGEDGYFLYPAIRETEQQNVDTYLDALDDLVSRNGLA